METLGSEAQIDLTKRFLFDFAGLLRRRWGAEVSIFFLWHVAGLNGVISIVTVVNCGSVTDLVSFLVLDSATSSACAEQTGIELGAGYPGVSRSATGTRHGVVQVCAVLSSLSHLMHFLDVAPRMCCRSRMWPCVRTVASTHYAHRLAFRAAWGTPRLQN